MQTPANTVTVQPVSSQVIGMPVSQAWAPPVGQPVVIATPVVPNGQYNPKQGVVQAVPVQPKVVHVHVHFLSQHYRLNKEMSAMYIYMYVSLTNNDFCVFSNVYRCIVFVSRSIFKSTYH